MRTPLIVLFLILTINSFGQKASEKVSKEICECVHKKLPDTEQVHVMDSVNACFGQAMALNRKELNKEFKIKSTTVEAMIETRDRLLKILRKKCIYFRK